MNQLDIGSGGMPAPAEPKTNPLTPLSPGQEQALTGQRPQSPMMEAFSTELSRAQARFEKLSEVATKIDHARVQLQKLAAMGDAVTQDDVISAAGTLVGQGLGAVPIASLLADMPTQGGEALQAWVAKVTQNVIAKEQMLQQPLMLARHELAVTGLHNLVGHAAEAHLAQAAQTPPQEGPVQGVQEAAAQAPGAGEGSNPFELAPQSGAEEPSDAG